MAVHAHHHPSIAGLSDLCNRAGNNVEEELYLPQSHQSNVFGNRYGASRLAAINKGLILSEPQSDLTCGASRSRKRVAPEPPQSAMALSQNNPVAKRLCYYLAAGEIPLISVSGYQQNQFLQSGGTSTSGRWELVSHLLQHNAEIDAILRLQSHRMHSGLKDMWRRQCVELVGGMEQRAARRLREKDEELENARGRISDLEERLRQATADMQMWFGLAKNNEAVAAGLQASLEDVLLRNAAAAVVQDEEGYGDNEQDAQSCCCVPDAPASELSRGRKGACRACGDATACVLLLPCRHLCLCSPCASKTDTCPECRSEKKTFLEVILVS